ncbi:hypothetical protein PISL3812_06837 [Talaromyces islandicus]|uniref:Uncharacterized protein n=1 Tax=Talaromyces islandicus TaxID=28573 RepID=A0A0U1M2I5_TALIS|nr:hypothetical protein PISL3812_06837 [Talaromyces islandicus]
MTNPDLSAVLQTLSTFSQQNKRPLPSTNTTTTTTTNTTSTSPPKHQLSPSSSSSTSSSHQKPTTNPATITTWPPALRHIMHQTATTHSHFTAHIRRLITTQHALERKWWEEREALVARQAAREERKRELERVLQSVGATTTAATATTATDSSSSTTSDQQTKENAVELAYHDAKVYKAAAELSRTTEAELRRLGVPFFAVDESLVLSATDKDTVVEGKISKEQLAVLKRRMLELLQDLCRD